MFLSIAILFFGLGKPRHIYVSKVTFCVLFIPLVLILSGILNIFINGNRLDIDINILIISFRQNILLFNYTLFAIILLNNVSSQLLYKFLYYSITFAMIYGLIDFILANYFGIQLDNYFYRYSNQTNTGYILGIMRNRSFFGEPGTYSLFLNTTCPLLLNYRNNFKSKVSKLSLYLLIIISFILTFSVAGFVVLLIVFVLISKKNLISFFTALFFLNSLILLYYSGIPIIENLKDKLFLNTVSGTDRISRLIFFRDTIFNCLDHPSILLFGHGPGWIKSNFAAGGLVNTYAEILLEYGFFTLIIIIAFYLSFYKRIALLNNVYFKYVYIACPIQLFFTSEYVHCFIFFSFCLLIHTCNQKMFYINDRFK